MLQLTATTPDRATADRIARELVEERLAACVQIGGPITSTYRWEGRVETAQEWLVVAKTIEERFEAAATAIREAHPYETPEVIATPITQADAAYAAWVREQTGV